jgi:hypothetical protein
MLGCLTFAGIVGASVSCIKRDTANVNLELSVYNGIRDVVRIGDSEALVASHTQFNVETLSVADDAMATKLGFTAILKLADIGTTVYFRQGRAQLIRVQEPFRGPVQGKDLQVFNFAAPQGKTWEEILKREFGPPMIRASGGRLSSEALFYSWGDVSYNRMGPNEIAIYREMDVGTFRQRSFGRDVQLFKN